MILDPLVYLATGIIFGSTGMIMFLMWKMERLGARTNPPSLDK